LAIEKGVETVNVLLNVKFRHSGNQLRVYWH